MLTASEIRSRFLEFFRRHQHAVVPSGPLVPKDDPSLLFTNAGMVQFKRLFLGEGEKPYSRAASCQKCLRVSGKHNDLENVGRTARHHTFFEMLGNFSFGDYFKEEAISWAWEFVTRELGLPPEKLWVTIYKDDDEAFDIWRKVAGLPPERIVRMGEKDNFWTMGDTGPCGPCSEIYIDQGEDMACGSQCGIGSCDCDRFLEIWNLVFTQFDQQSDGKRTMLAAPNIDTGMGLERIAAVCQGKRSNFDCDLFQEIIQYAANLAGVKYSGSAPDTDDTDTALRVIADHARAAAFLVAEGVLPSNESRGYVLRRLIRRALRFAALMGVNEPFLYQVSGKVCEVMGPAWPELARHADFVKKAVEEEERRFALTLGKGLRLLDEELAKLQQANIYVIPGEICFRLYDTYGFPLDIVSDVAGKRGFGIDAAGFERLMAEQRERARANQKKTGLFGQGNESELLAACQKLEREGLCSKFIGYSSLKAETEILALLDGAGSRVKELGEGADGYILTASTPFYGESGGQAGDSGIAQSASGHVRVSGAIKPVASIILLQCHVTAGEVHEGQKIQLEVDPDTRQATARNHTCTHLLHAALRSILGDHVHQAGSSVDSARLRFDFTHSGALSSEEVAAVERSVNRAIMADFIVEACEMPYDDAIAKGAMALFSEKYGDNVRVLTIGSSEQPESVELCGGTHLERTGQAGSFYIINESAVGSGVRRIEAVTGWQAYDYAIGQRSENARAAAALKTVPGELAQRAQALQDELKKLRKLRDKSEHNVSGAELVKKFHKYGKINLLEEKFEQMSVPSLRLLMDDVRSRMQKESVACIASVEKDKVSIILYVSKDLHSLFNAPELIRIVAEPCNGSGGGRPDQAQAGGNNPAGLARGFQLLQEFIEEKAK